MRCDFGRRISLRCNRMNRRRRFSSLRSHAIADDQKNQNEQQYSYGAGDMPLVEIRDLRPSTPRVPAIREDTRKKIALLPDGLNRGAN